MKRLMTFKEAIEACKRVPKGATDSRSFRKSNFAKFIQDGHMIKGMLACHWKTGDGKKYGWKSDGAMLSDACHYGFRMIRID